MAQRWLIATCILASLATAVSAQLPERRGFGGLFSGQGRLLVDLPEVRKELGASD